MEMSEKRIARDGDDVREVARCKRAGVLGKSQVVRGRDRADWMACMGVRRRGPAGRTIGVSPWAETPVSVPKDILTPARAHDAPCRSSWPASSAFADWAGG